jgi:hypothetical protein
MARQKAPAPIIKRTVKGFALIGPYDAELIEADPVGTEYDLVKRSKRSLPQLRLYWQALAGVVRATDQWPSAEHLHEDIKLSLGYVRKSVNLRTCEVVLSVDSAGFDAMSADEFKLFFDKAMQLLAEQCGIDPLAFYGHGRAA